MQPRRHRMRQRQRRASARDWIRTSTLTVDSYARRYGVDRYTAYEDLAALGLPVPDSAQQWSRRPPATPRRAARPRDAQPDHPSWIMLDGRPFLVAGYTSGGAPYGLFADEIPDQDPL
jgi:hypothetical protein